MMSYGKILSGRQVDRNIDVQTVVTLLVEKFGAVRQAHDQFRNLLWLGGKIWWVITSTSDSALDICGGRHCDKSELLRQIHELHAGLLVFRQMEDNLIFIYLIDDLEKIRLHHAFAHTLDWGAVDEIKLLAETGIMIGNELLGFRKFRQLHNLNLTAPKTPNS